LLGVPLVVLLAILNSSRLAPPPSHRWRFLAHRGVHQTFEIDGVDDNTCTASRIRPPTHQLIENTLPSMQAAFTAGADEVEIDVHLSSDGVPMVFHDATLGCRTDATGAPEQHTAAELQRIDVGWGYTDDGGRTFPLRGTVVGLMPTFDEVLAALPGRRLLIHFKTNRVSDGEAVAARLARLPVSQRALVSVYGGEAPAGRVAQLLPEVRAFDAHQVKRCLVEYEILGWSDYMPTACRHTRVVVPMEHAGKLWGWPRRFEARLRSVGSDAILVRSTFNGHLSGIDDENSLNQVPTDFSGWVWTNRIESFSPQGRSLLRSLRLRSPRSSGPAELVNPGGLAGNRVGDLIVGERR
jgi:glycerophosphoryl diester phosphodiesterase